MLRSRATASGDISTSAQEIIESYTTGMYLCIISNLSLIALKPHAEVINRELSFAQKVSLQTGLQYSFSEKLFQ